MLSSAKLVKHVVVLPVESAGVSVSAPGIKTVFPKDPTRYPLWVQSNNKNTAELEDGDNGDDKSGDDNSGDDRDDDDNADHTTTLFAPTKGGRATGFITGDSDSSDK